MPILRTIGKLLILNTIDKLPPNKKVKISKDDVNVSSDGHLYLNSKAQFVSGEVDSDQKDYMIMVERDVDGNFVIDLTELPVAFFVSKDETIEKLDKSIWINCSVETEIHTDEYDYLIRYKLSELFDEYDEILDDKIPITDKKYVFVRDLLIEKITVSTDQKTMNEIIAYFDSDFESDIRNTSELGKKEKDKALKHYSSIKPDTMKLVKLCEERMILLNGGESCEQLQEKYWLAKDAEEWLEVRRLSALMKEKGFPIEEERPVDTE